MPAPADDVVLACRHVSKLYGHDVGRFLDGSGRAGRAGAAQMAAAGVVSAVIDVDLDIGRGETFVIMGLSGSGKSTLVRCLAGLIEPSGGQVLFEGRDLFRLPERELIQLRRHKMGMVFQHFALLPHLTVLGNVAFPLDVQGVPRAEREARAQEMIELVGLKGRERHFPRELSGGQQQRVGIARSLAADPELWFLDEPFSALDPMIRREMQDELQRLQSILNKTVVFITHDFDEAVRLADRIAIMKDGRLVQVGTAEELILHPASDYVRAFTRDAPRAKILTARAIMRPVAPGETGVAGMVPASSPIAGFAQQVEASDRPFAVVEDGRILGVIDRRAMMDVLVGRDLAPAAGEPAA